MADARPEQPSIRRRLLTYLVTALLLVILGVAVVTYVVAHRSANDAYDRSLLDPALDISEHMRVDAEGIHVDLPQNALEALVYDQVDQVIYQLRGPDGTLVAGVQDLPLPAGLAAGDHRFADIEYRGAPMRVAALRGANGAYVQVAETLHKRHQLVAEILSAEIATMLVVGLAAIALAWVGIANGLRPLERLRNDLLARSIRDLRPLTPAPAPAEIAPVIDAFNALLAQLRDASTMQQRFVANAAHQLRTPLAGLQMHLELLLRHDLAADVRDEIDRLRGASVRASRLATQLLALARAEPGQVHRRPLQRLDLRQVAGEAARDWAPRAVALDRDLGFQLDPAMILGDATLLPEIVNNLVDNALRYTPRGGTITVRTGYDGGRPYLAVEDNGPGIPERERGNVLERFYRLPDVPGDGSGLGLSIVKEAAERHGGAIEIGPGEGGRGTCVRVVFPPLAPEAAIAELTR